MIAVIIQARMNSNRLPGKVMMKIKNKPLLHYVLSQIRHSNLLEKTIVATTDLAEDDIIEEFVLKEKIDCYRGSSKDVLDRYYQCAKEFKIETIVRISADCPLIDPNIIDVVIRKFLDGKYDYVTNSLTRTFPHGMDVEIFSFKTLENAWNNAKLPSEREHVTPYIYNQFKEFKKFNVTNSENFSNLRIVVDRKNDFQLIKQIFSKIEKQPILLKDILELFKKEPDIFSINKEYQTDEGYLKSLKEDKEFLKNKIGKLENE